MIFVCLCKFSDLKRSITLVYGSFRSELVSWPQCGKLNCFQKNPVSFVPQVLVIQLGLEIILRRFLAISPWIGGDKCVLNFSSVAICTTNDHPFSNFFRRTIILKFKFSAICFDDEPTLEGNFVGWALCNGQISHVLSVDHWVTLVEFLLKRKKLV